MSNSEKRAKSPQTNKLWIWLILLGLTLIAAGLRLWRLDALPPGLFFDEAFNGLDARGVATGQHFPLYFTANNGREPLYIYLQAMAVALLGPTAYALRLTSALIGIATVPITYAGARMILGSRAGDGGESGFEQRMEWLALIAAAGMAVSFWHVSVSRLAFRAVLLPPLSMLAVAYFWRGWVRQRMADYRWAGFWFGLTFYTYTAARLLPFVVIAFLLIEIVVDLLVRRERFMALWRPRVRGLAWLTGVGLVTLLPLMAALVQDPQLISSRTGDVSIFTVSEKDMPGTPVQRLLHNTGAMVRNFYTAGDRNLRHNIPGRPVNDWLLAGLFTLGWLAALWRLREPRMRLLLLWFGVMALPSLLSTDAPHALRAIGMLPPLVILYALGAQAIMDGLARWVAPRIMAPAILAAILLVSGGITANDYFNRWAGERGLVQAFDLDLQLAAERMVDLLTGDQLPILTTRDLYLTPHLRYAVGALPRVDDEGGALPAGDAHLLIKENAYSNQLAFLIWRQAGEPVAAGVDGRDGAPLVTQLASTPGLTRVTAPGIPDDWSSLREGRVQGMDFQAARPRYPLDATFANGLQLLGYDMTPDAIHPDGDEPFFNLTTYWRLAPDHPTPDSERFDIFAHLVYAGGQIQENGGLGQGYPIDLWQPGEMVDDRRLLVIPPETAATMQPGKAHFEVGLFDTRTPEGVDRIGILDGEGNVAADSVAFGPVAIDMDPPQAPMDDLARLDVVFDGVMELAGWRAEPGDEGLTVELAWRALDRPPTDYTVFVHLLDKEGQIAAQFDQPPGGPENPTRFWLPGESARAAFPLAAPSLDQGPYSLRMGLYEPVSGRQATVTSGGEDGLATEGETFVVIPLEGMGSP
jgi:4-amino-4-deoxy-L-arabinose transferase-like glycosyltransferase